MKANFAQKSRLTDKKGIPPADLIISANTIDINAVTDVIDNAINKRGFLYPFPQTKRRRGKYHLQQHLCLDRAYNYKSIEKYRLALLY
jgi:hypothetical protein